MTEQLITNRVHIQIRIMSYIKKNSAPWFWIRNTPGSPCMLLNAFVKKLHNWDASLIKTAIRMWELGLKCRCKHEQKEERDGEINQIDCIGLFRSKQ